MATMYHISSNGEANPCTAKKTVCPLKTAGSQHAEFENPDDAQYWAEQEMSLRHGGTFGSLAMKLAEKDLTEEERVRAEEAEIRFRQEGRALQLAAEHAKDFFSPDNLERLKTMKLWERRKATKKLDEIADSFGAQRDSAPAKLFLLYLDHYDFSNTTSVDRSIIRDAVVSARMIYPTVSSNAFKNAIHQQGAELEKMLDDVPNEEKEELNLSPYATGPRSAMEQLTNEELTEELAKAEDRESYFGTWNGKAKMRHINYGVSVGRYNRRKEIFGWEYDRIVSRGPSTGYTVDEAKYFEDQQPARWETFHQALKEEAEGRLNP